MVKCLSQWKNQDNIVYNSRLVSISHKSSQSYDKRISERLVTWTNHPWGQDLLSLLLNQTNAWDAPAERIWLLFAACQDIRFTTFDENSLVHKLHDANLVRKVCPFCTCMLRHFLNKSCTIIAWCASPIYLALINPVRV